MTVPALLAAIRARDIHVWAERDQLQCNAPAGALTPELRDELSRRKGEILEYLRGPAEVSFSQQRLWFLDQAASAGTAYVMAKAIELRGSLDVRSLERALEALIARHESLRTVFTGAGARPLQVVTEPAPWTLPVADLSAETNARERLAQLLRDEALLGIDLARGPLFRARLYRVAVDTHVLLLTMHHIISDGWSLGILLREIGELYVAFSRGNAPALPAVPFQYRDFARWQRSWLNGERLEALLSHWQSRLTGAPQVLELPADRPRPAVATYRGATHSFMLPPGLADRLRALSRREEATLFMTLLAGFTALLSRYSGQQDMLVGTPVANRSRAEFEHVVGFFVNTLVLRADLTGDPTVRQLLARTRDMCLDALAHQHVPLERLVETMRPHRDLSRNPLFQVMFSLENLPDLSLAIPGLATTPVGIERLDAQVDLTLTVQETSDGLRGLLEYSSDLFEESTIARMATHLRSLLEAMVAHPEARLGELPLLTEDERRQLLIGWNGKDTDPGAEGLLHQSISAQAARKPDAVAVVSHGRSLSYRELDRRANQLAHALRKRGVGPEVLVGVCVNRGPGMIVAVLGVLKAGGAYVPLDPDYPAERLAFMLEDCGAKVLVTEERLRKSLPPLPAGCGLIRLDQDAGALAAESEEEPGSEVAPCNLAYAIYTSGSTGRPKAALVTHQGLANLAASECMLYGVDPDSRVLQFSSLSFDTSLSEIAMALCTGGRLHVEERDTLMPGPDLERYLEQEKITVLSLTPSALAMLDRAAGPALQQVIVGGEVCPVDLARDWGGRCRFFNTYGPTEATVTTTYVEYRDGKLPPLIGRPLPNVRVYLLDQGLQPVPVGVTGELYIGGKAVARGYLNRAELTAERFVPDPFCDTPGARMYRSGDYARWRHDGQIEFVGRKDDQVKLRGYRIELGEIESALRQHPEVRDAAVMLREDEPGDRRLVAYVTPAGARPSLVDELRSFLKQRLPAYMAPAAYVLLDALPRTPNDKLDRKALPAPGRTGLGSAGLRVAPRTPAEKVVADIWCEVLKLEEIGVDDDFFDLGGHSLLAMQVVSRIRDIFEAELPLRSLFESPTVARVTASLLGASGKRPQLERRADLLLKVLAFSDSEVESMLAHPGFPAEVRSQ